MSCDGDFGDIEKAKKKKDSIYTIQQYEEVMMSSKTKKNKPTVIHMQSEDFFDFVKGINFKNLNEPLDTDGKKFNWLQIHEFKYEQKLFGFKFRYNLSDEYRTCFLGKKSNRSNRPTEPKFTEMPVLYPSGLKLKAPKVVDMMTLLSFVPAVYQDWYKKIIQSHKQVVAAYKKQKKNKKKGKTNEDEDEDEEEEELVF